MMILHEIDAECFCYYSDKLCESGCKRCKYRLHKWPTMKQFEEEYGTEVPEGQPIFISDFSVGAWKHNVWFKDKAKLLSKHDVRVSTIWGYPPEEEKK